MDEWQLGMMIFISCSHPQHKRNTSVWVLKYGTYDKEDTFGELVAFPQLNQVVFQQERIAVLTSILRTLLRWPGAKVHVHQLDLQESGFVW